MCIKGPPKPYLPVPRSCYPYRPPPRASTSPATAAALLPMGEPRPPRPPASRALRRLPPPPLLLLSGSALRTRRPTLPLHPRHRAANPPASTPLPLFLLRSASCSLSLIEGRGHRLPWPRRRRDGPLARQPSGHMEEGWASSKPRCRCGLGPPPRRASPPGGSSNCSSPAERLRSADSSTSGCCIRLNKQRFRFAYYLDLFYHSAISFSPSWLW